MQDVTLVVKTILRPASLRRLLRSVRSFYPALEISVGDDTPGVNGETAHFVEGEFCANYLRLPEDCGLAAGRNQLVAGVNTSYTMLVDDDFEFISTTKLEMLKHCIEQFELDIVGGWLLIVAPNDIGWHCTGTLQRHEGLLEIDDASRAERCKLGCHIVHSFDWEGKPEVCRQVEIILNFFMAKTEVLRKAPWDEQFKLAEHHDFFLNAKQQGLKIGVCPSVLALHHVDQPPAYAQYRNRLVDFQHRFLAKRGLRSIQFDHVELWQ